MKALHSKSSNSWVTYRTRFLVQAKQLTASLTFTDALGRFHSGRKGDYLMETSDGVLRIAPRQIFEDIYVPLLEDQYSKSTLFASASPRSPESLPLHLARKSPQPESHRRTSPGLRSL
jgi:hypothetical protein